MGKLGVDGFTISLDGYGAGPRQDLDNGLGVGGGQLHRWLVPARTFKAFHGGKEGTTGIDDDYARRGTENIGAWIMGRNMFGPIRGDWPDEGWLRPPPGVGRCGRARVGGLHHRYSWRTAT